MCVFTIMAIAGGAAGIGAGATLATSGLLIGTSLGSALMSDVGLLSGGFSAFSSMQQSDSQAGVYEHQAAVETTNQALRANDRLRAMRMNVSTQMAQFGALGINPLTGSAPLAMTETAYNTSLDIFNDQFSSDAERDALMASGRNIRSAGRTKAVGTLLNTSISAVERYS